MGSVNSSDIPVVAKETKTFIKQPRAVRSLDSETDTEANIVYRVEPRSIGSGSIVRGDGSVEYLEENSWGTTFQGRTTTERVASKPGNTRDLRVEDVSYSVIPDGSGIPRVSQRGSHVIISDPVEDRLLERVSNTGVYG